MAGVRFGDHVRIRDMNTGLYLYVHSDMNSAAQTVRFSSKGTAFQITNAATEIPVDREDPSPRYMKSTGTNDKGSPLAAIAIDQQAVFLLNGQYLYVRTDNNGGSCAGFNRNYIGIGNPGSGDVRFAMKLGESQSTVREDKETVVYGAPFLMRGNGGSGTKWWRVCPEDTSSILYTNDNSSDGQEPPVLTLEKVCSPGCVPHEGAGVAGLGDDKPVIQFYFGSDGGRGVPTNPETLTRAQKMQVRRELRRGGPRRGKPLISKLIGLK